ncbi:ATP-binding protein [Streptomyces sp. NPDC055897]
MLLQDAALIAVSAGAAGAAGFGALAVHYRRQSVERLGEVHRLRAQFGAANRRVEERDEEAEHFARVRLPALIDATALRDPTSVKDALRHPHLANTPADMAYHAALARVSELAGEASERAEGTARAAVQAVVRSFQALINEQQTAITSLLNSPNAEDTLGLAIAIDHASSQLARRAQIVGILTGLWPGRQRHDAPLTDTVRGGVSRIRDYTRVSITGERGEQVIGRVVEPVALAMAELLDNAARYSEPGTHVDVWYVGAHHGLSVVIDDAGIGLSPEDRQRAAHLLSGQDPVRITELRNPPRFGFLAVGQLAARYGFTVSVEQQSVHGGVRAVLHLPHALLATPGSAVPTSVDSAPQQAPVAPDVRALDQAAQGPSQPYEVDERDGLPIRRRRPATRPSPAAPQASPPPPGAGRSLAAFTRGTASARHALNDQEHPS